MKTITALLMMTSVAEAQASCYLDDCFCPGPVACQAQPRMGDGRFTFQPFPSAGTGGTLGAAVDRTYTLVLRDKLGHTMLIRWPDNTNAGGDVIMGVCERMAGGLKASPDIESADCFK